MPQRRSGHPINPPHPQSSQVRLIQTLCGSLLTSKTSLWLRPEGPLALFHGSKLMLKLGPVQ